MSWWSEHKENVRNYQRGALRVPDKQAQHDADVTLGVKIALGVVAGVAVAEVINGFAAGGDGWKIAALQSQLGIQS